MSTLLALVVEPAEAGKVFKGLIGKISATEAARLYRSSIMDLCEIYAGINVRSRILLYGPKEARKQIELMGSRHWRAVAHNSDNRGAVMMDLAERAFKGGHRRVLAVWPKAPTVPPEFILNAFDQLLVDDLVIGPTTDGDVYAIGFSTDVPYVFQGFDWDEREHVFDHMIDRAERLNLVMGLMPHFYAIDEPRNLPVLASHLRAEILSEGHARTPRLAAVMHKLVPGREPGTAGV